MSNFRSLESGRALLASPFTLKQESWDEAWFLIAPWNKCKVVNLYLFLRKSLPGSTITFSYAFEPPSMLHLLSKSPTHAYHLIILRYRCRTYWELLRFLVSLPSLSLLNKVSSHLCQCCRNDRICESLHLRARKSSERLSHNALWTFNLWYGHLFSFYFTFQRLAMTFPSAIKEDIPDRK